MDFRYQVERLWQVPVEQILQAPPALLPLAPISMVAEQEVRNVVEEIDDRLRSASESVDRPALLAAAFLLLGLRFDPIMANRMMEGVMELKESKTYQWILEEGHRTGLARGLVEGKAEGKAEGKVEGTCEEARRILLRLGSRRLGEPSPEVVRAVAALDNVEQIEALIEKVVSGESWGELFGS